MTISQLVTVTGNVHLILKDDCYLAASKGITVSDEGSALTIYGQEKGTGSMYAYGSDGNAGIGGLAATESEDGSAGGNVTIHGGVVYAYGSRASGGGAGIGGGGNFEAGSTVTVTAAADSGCRFVRWTENGNEVSTSASYSFTLTADRSLTAEFADNPGGSAPDPTYKPVVDAPDGVEVTTDPVHPKPGDKVTIKTEPEGDVTVTDKDGNPVGVTRNPDGTWSYIQPNGSVTITFTLREGQLPFVDVIRGDWFYNCVEYVYFSGLMDGVSDTRLDPNGGVTRAMVWAILSRMDGETVTGGNWAETARAWAMAAGVSDGTDATGLVTRE